MRRSVIWCIALAAVGTATLAATAWSRPAGGGVWLQVRDGTRVKARGDSRVYLVDHGALRYVTYDAYVKLWRGWGGIVEVADIPSSLLGARLETDARLVKADDDPAVWLVDGDGTKRQVADVPTFDAYGFSWSLVEIVSADDIGRLSTGTPIE